MNNYIILIDFGSTFTKMVIVNRKEKNVISTINYPSTVDDDASLALNFCLNYAKGLLGSKAVDEAAKYASSSAAGGLRLSVIGITDNLSMQAGKNAAFGSGGKIVHKVSGKIDTNDVERIKASNCEIVLLCGGYNNGNTSIVRHNAEVLATSNLQVPIIYCGNDFLNKEIYLLMKRYNKDCYIVSNIIPDVGAVNSIDTENIIRNIFMKRIIRKKGLSAVSEVFDSDIVPTPATVLIAGELLSKGTNKIKGIGDLIITDIGGATTDIHSYSENYPYEGAKIIGVEEPYSKRTVEGDLGMRESSNFIIKEFEINTISDEIGMEVDEIHNSIKIRLRNKKILPDSDIGRKLDQYIAMKAVYLAARRHAGNIEPVHSGLVKYIQHGKNLSKVRTIIGTGGQLVHSTNPYEILQNVCCLSIKDKYNLLPTEINCKIDYDYILYSVGLISMHDKELAMELLKDNFMTN